LLSLDGSSDGDVIYVLWPGQCDRGEGRGVPQFGRCARPIFPRSAGTSTINAAHHS